MLQKLSVTKNVNIGGNNNIGGDVYLLMFCCVRISCCFCYVEVLWVTIVLWLGLGWVKE